MKNKSKLNKIKEKKQNIQIMPGEWLYFASAETTVREIAGVLEGDTYELEIWEEAGVLEIGMSEGATVDFEQAQIHPKDEVTAEFARENGCETVFLVTFVPENYEKAEKIMRRILKENGGVFCADTEELKPALR